MDKLKPCPCGETPETLLLNNSLGEACGTCCNMWSVEFRVCWNDNLENFKSASKAWNEASRANKDTQALEKQVEFLKRELIQLASFNPDWDMLQVTKDSLVEHMSLVKNLNIKIGVLIDGVSMNGWHDMDFAPKDGAEILLEFNENKVSVGYWDAYYAEGGRGYEGGLAWIEPVSGERLDLNYDAPIGFMILPTTSKQED